MSVFMVLLGGCLWISRDDYDSRVGVVETDVGIDGDTDGEMETDGEAVDSDTAVDSDGETDGNEDTEVGDDTDVDEDTDVTGDTDETDVVVDSDVDTDSSSIDLYGDGYSADEGNCDETDDAVSPAADEICDEIDNDCNEGVDESSSIDAPTWYADGDSDSFGDPETTTVACDKPAEPLLELLQGDLEIVASGGFLATTQALNRAQRVATYSDEIAASAVAIARVAARRSKSPDPYAAERSALLPTLMTRGPRQLAHDAFAVLEATAFRTATISPVIVEVLAMVRQGYDANLASLAKALARPRHPDSAHADASFSTIMRETSSAAGCAIAGDPSQGMAGVEIRVGWACPRGAPADAARRRLFNVESLVRTPLFCAEGYG